MTYDAYTGVHYQQSKVKKYLIGAAVAAAMLIASAVPTFAANDYCGATGNGPANGCEHSMSNTQCAGHGAFGAFGQDNSWAGGASGDNTALANSTLCGNPSPNSSAATPGDHPN